jgi:hypothetical protein
MSTHQSNDSNAILCCFCLNIRCRNEWNRFGYSSLKTKWPINLLSVIRFHGVWWFRTAHWKSERISNLRRGKAGRSISRRDCQQLFPGRTWPMHMSQSQSLLMLKLLQDLKQSSWSKTAVSFGLSLWIPI